jgi:hydroxyacylglutathione hydrolase
MIFDRFEDDGLAHYSYAVGSETAREVAVVDPRRDIREYLDFARQRGLRISHVLETHIHADYASGAAELARRAGAPLHLSAYDEGEHYDVEYPHEPLREDDEIVLGEVRLRAVHTPGHTPEHLSFLVHDGSRPAPVRFLTGDFLFIGSLGRPDLLGEDVKQALARDLFRSVRRVLPDLPDDLRVHPAHGSGSMCGGGMSKTPERSLEEERVDNPFLDSDLDEATFIRRLLESLPPYPDYYLRMKERNAGGAGFGRPWPAPVALDPVAFRDHAADGMAVIDTRHPLAFGGGHIPDAYGIGLSVDLSEWAGWVAPYDRPLLLVLEDEHRLEEVLTRLARVGLDRVDGYLAGDIGAWLTAGLPLRSLPQIPPAELAPRLDELVVLDVRTDDEWDDGHIDGAIHVMGGELEDRLDELPDRDAEIAVTCSTGYRSTVAASLLQRHGFTRVRNVPGGMDGWKAAELPVV